MLLRGRRPLHWLFAGFATDVAFWYGSQSLEGLFQAPIWIRATSVLTVLLPQFAVHLFEAIVPAPAQERPSPLRRIATFALVPALALALSPYHQNDFAIAGIYLYVLLLLSGALVSLARRGQKDSSRSVRERVRFLVVVGALAMTFTLLDFSIRKVLPPIGAVLAIVFLFVLAESLTRPRLAYLYEMAGRLLVSTALAFALAGIFYGFVTYLGRWGEMYLNAVLTAIVFLVLFEPLQHEVEQRIHRFFFRERHDLETSVTELRHRLGYTLEIEETIDTLLTGLEQSRRITSCALYLRDADGNGFDLSGSRGAAAPPRLETLAIRPILDQFAGHKSLSLEEAAKEAKAPLVTAADTLGDYRMAIMLAIRGGEDIIGLLCVVDERMRDAFTPEEISLLETVTAQVEVAIANSRVYARMKERDRLAALGAMAAGLAHEVKNPLGAIKGAAQLLEDTPGGDPASREFLGIILEETDRLNRVVGSFLDYARPHAGNPIALDINAAVRRTVQILQSQFTRDLELRLELDSDGPLPWAKIDPEKFRQVLINLVQNAVQAMDGHGRVTISTGRRRSSRAGRTGPPPSERNVLLLRPEDQELIEVAVRDTGPGISQKVLKNLFVPFITTKDRGTGLGLAISQSIVQNAGGSIDVQTQPGAGTKFTIVLPASEPGLGSMPPPPPPRPAEAT